MYVVTTPPNSEDPKQILEWAFQELTEIAGLLANIEQGKFLDLRSTAPQKPRESMLAFADGVNWNPGSGKGMYCYYNSAWHFLG